MKLKQAATQKGEHKLEPPKVIYIARLYFKENTLKLGHKMEYTRCDPKVLRRVVLKEYCALHLAADTVTT